MNVVFLSSAMTSTLFRWSASALAQFCFPSFFNLVRRRISLTHISIRVNELNKWT